ncbi:MAG: sugar ABC transporter substrate-binding protein [Spirochaetaceae bacterium]|nr:sugar ABC transporter substrate-binding protein [Spirochaetaceae bacterium]
MNRLRIVPIVAVLLSAMAAGSVFAAAAGEGAAAEERGPIEMTYLRFGGPDDITQEEALIARWEEANPGDTVEPLIAPFPQFKEKLDTMIAGGQSPDIIFGWPTPFANLWANERIISLNELVQGDVDFNIDDYPQHKQFIFDGELTGIPYNATAHILVYNKTMFEEAGLETPIEMYNRGAWTWSNAIEVAKQLTVDENGDGVPDQYGMVNMGDNPVPIMTAVWAHGGRLFNEDFNEITFDSPETREALQMLVDLVRVHEVAPPPEMQASEIGISFNSGKVAIGRQSAATIMLRHIRWEEPWEWDIVPFPAGPKGFAAWADGNSLGISVSAPDQLLAWDFVTSLVDEESWQVRFDLGLPFRLPPNINVINSPTFRELWSYVDVDMILDVMLGEKALTPLVPRQADAFRIAYNVMDTEVENAVRGDITVEEAIDATVKQANDILAGF